MCAAKTSKRPGLQRVAKYLYRRGNSYEFRRAIPERAQHLFDGIATFSRSMGDVSRREADHLAADYRKHCDKLIAQASRQPDPTARATSLRLPTHTPSTGEIDRAVRVWLLEQESRAAMPSTPQSRKQTVRDMALIAELTPSHQREGRLSSLVGTQWIAEAIAEANHWSLPEDGQERFYLIDRVGRAQRELAVRVKAEVNYEDRPAPTHAMFDPAAFDRDREVPATNVGPPVPIMDVFERYAAEQEPNPKTAKKWKTALRSLIEHLGHDDARKVRPEDVVAWKDALLSPAKDGTTPRGQATVRNGYLGAIKPVFQWATQNKLISSNPATGITVNVPKRRLKRPTKGYTDEEAKVVLSAALAINWRSEGTFTAFAYRWLPWLCAYTGARIGEMAQLRDQDVGCTKDGIWYVTITPEAGSQKGGFARQVALHPHLIEQGFIAAINGRKGPIFYDPNRRRAGSDGNPQYVKVGERVARWVRSLGLSDKDLQPNHGWRHRFATVARRIGMDPDVRQAFIGHAAQTEHQEYGDVLIETSSKWMAVFPRFNVDEPPA